MYFHVVYGGGRRRYGGAGTKQSIKISYDVLLNRV